MNKFKFKKEESIKLRFLIVLAHILEINGAHTDDWFEVFLSILDNNCVCRCTDIIPDILLKGVNLFIYDWFLQIEVIVILSDFVHMEPLCDVQVCLVTMVEVHQTTEVKYHRVQR